MISIIDGPGLSGKCTLIPWRPRNIWGKVVYGQSKAVKHCIQNYGEESEWICFADIDEFLFSPCNVDICELLDDFKNDNIGCAVVTQKKFADRFLSLDRFVTDIYDCIDNLNTENWAPKNIVRPDCVDIGGIRNIHSFSVRKGRWRVLDQSLLRLNHYNVNPTQLRWMEKFFERKGIEINSLDMGMKRYQDYIHTRCKREADFYRIADRASIELKMLEI